MKRPRQLYYIATTLDNMRKKMKQRCTWVSFFINLKNNILQLSNAKLNHKSNETRPACISSNSNNNNV